MSAPYINIVGGYKLPAVGLGTFTVTDEDLLEKALDVALETGYRHIDTAFVYRNEHIIGKVLRKWFDSGKLKREDLFVTTKIPGCPHPDQVEQFISKSLSNLQLEYVDLYLIHIPICFKMDPDVPLSQIEATDTDIVSTWKKMEDLVEQGRTKSIGISNFNQEQIERILKIAKIIPATNQIELHVYLQQSELVKFCQDNGIGVVSYFSLGNPGLPTWLEKNKFPPASLPDLLNDPTVKKLASKYNKRSAQILLRFLTQKNIAVIPKSVTPSRIKENFDLFTFTLGTDDVKELERLDKGPLGRINKLEQHKSHPEYPFEKDL